MEEILASIRRIISEDDAPAAEAETAPEPAAAPAPAPEPVAAAAPAPEPEPAPEPAAAAPAPGSLREPDDETLVSLPTSFAAASAFGQLTAAIAMPAAGRTLEDLVRELLNPLLKEWLDQNLPQIVEAKVAEEVERIARRVR